MLGVYMHLLLDLIQYDTLEGWQEEGTGQPNTEIQGKHQMGMNLRTDTYKIKMYLISNDNKINNSQWQNLSKKKSETN